MHYYIWIVWFTNQLFYWHEYHIIPGQFKVSHTLKTYFSKYSVYNWLLTIFYGALTLYTTILLLLLSLWPAWLLPVHWRCTTVCWKLLIVYCRFNHLLLLMGHVVGVDHREWPTSSWLLIAYCWCSWQWWRRLRSSCNAVHQCPTF